MAHDDFVSKRTEARASTTPQRSRIVRAACLGAIALIVLGCIVAAECLSHQPLSDTSDNLGSSLGAAADSSANATGLEESAWPTPLADPLGAEEYAHLDEPGFVPVAAQPLSTLSADVDTASYCNLRRMASDGVAPGDVPAGAVRTEEMLNYFDYDYAAPAEGELFGVTAQAGACPWNPDTVLLILGFSTQAHDAADPDGSNLVFLIDTSGSMNSCDKLSLLKDSFATLINQLDERDRVSIVTYSGEECIILEGASGADKATIMHAVESLDAHGATNGGAGLATAYEVARRNFIKDGVNRIVMASDGDLNVGMTSEGELHDFVEHERESGVYLSVLGFGDGNYKDTKMEVLADCGNGMYHYIDCIDEANRVLSENLRSNFVPLADDVKVQVEFNPAQIKGYRLIGYENRTLAAEEFEDDSIDAGEVGAGHQFTVAYEVVPAESSFEISEPDLKYNDSNGSGSWRDAEQDNSANERWPDAGKDEEGSAEAPAERAFDPVDSSDEWLTCSVRYKPAEHDESVEQQAVVDASSFSKGPHADWHFAAAVIEYSMLLRDSDYAGSASHDEALQLARRGTQGDFAQEREGFISLMESFERNKTTRAYLENTR